jgi:SAM-dependent methyltransferase
MSDLRGAWDAEADHWVRFARTPGHDRSFWDFGLPILLALLPSPSGLCVDIGCGEGRLPRLLRSEGYEVVGIDGSPNLVHRAMEAERGPYVVADAARLSLRDGCATLALAYMTLHDFDDLDGAVREIGRVLRSGGRFCFALVHPMSSAGAFELRSANARFVISGSYLEPRRYREDSDRGGVRMTFHSMHRPLEAYTRALENAGLLIETLREPPIAETFLRDDPAEARWLRLPLYLLGRAVKPGTP